MKYAMVLCLMVVAIGFNSETATATNSHTYCVCPCLTDILSVVPTSLANCILPSGLPSDLCQTLTGIVGILAGLLPTIVGIVTSILSGGLASLPVGTTSGIAGIGDVVDKICDVLESYTDDGGSNPIPADVCTYLNCLLRFLIDLIWALICAIIGLVRRIIGSAPINPSTDIDAGIVNALKVLLQALCELLGCISDGIACFASTKCYFKKKLSCIINEVQALGITEVNDFINNVLTDCIKKAYIYC